MPRVFGLILCLGILAQPAGAEIQYSLDNYFGFSGQNPKDGDAQALMAMSADLRPGLAYDMGNQGKLVLRARWEAMTLDRYTGVAADREKYSKGRIDLTDAYLESQWGDVVSTTMGLQVYQWGPSELLNPSNPFYHFKSQQKSAFFKEKGVVLLRMNHIGSAMSSSWLIEPLDNNERSWQVGKEFGSKAVGRFEWASQDDSSQYLGVVIGALEGGDQLFLGQYFNLSLREGWALYADAHEIDGASRYNVHKDPTTGFDELYLEQDARGQFQVLGDVGIRYEGDVDFRFEWIHNSAGFSKDDFGRARIGTQTLSPFLATNISRFLASGRELLTKNYQYLSLRKNLTGSVDQVLSLRVVRAENDSTLVSGWAYERSLADAWTLLVEVSLWSGDPDGELTSGQKWKLLSGCKWTL